jgi:hypothetical protein
MSSRIDPTAETDSRYCAPSDSPVVFDPFKKFSADYRVIPWATFVEPHTPP